MTENPKIEALKTLVKTKSHSGSSLLDHLIGTWKLLRQWQLPEAVCDAGLYHSIYGTGAYNLASVPADDRNTVRDIIGIDAERICFLFSALDRTSLLDWAKEPTSSGSVRFDVPIEPEEKPRGQTIQWLCHIAIANWLEQRPRCPENLVQQKDADYSLLLPTLNAEARAAFLQQKQAQHTSSAAADAADKVAALSRLFLWENPAEAMKTGLWAAQQHQKYIAENIAFLLQRDGEQQARRQALLNRFFDLDDTRLLRVLSAPKTCHFLFQAASPNADTALQWLEDALIVEQASDTDAEIPPINRERWSALGDTYIPAGGTTLVRNEGTHTLKNGLVIDFDSPYARETLVESNFRPKFGDAMAFTEAEHALTLQRLEDAARCIPECSVGAASFYTSVAKTVIPRKDNNTYKGSSNRGIVGRVNLYNPHLPYLDYGNIASSLVHEAIHIFLYIIEQKRPLFHSLDYAHTNFVYSPFSGKRVHVLAMVHATVVWFAILNFVALPASKDALPEKSRDYFINFCRKGFAGTNLLEQLEPHRLMIDETMFEQLLEMHALINERYL